MTDEERIERNMQHYRVFLAMDGYELTPWMERELREVEKGNQTTDELIQKVLNTDYREML